MEQPSKLEVARTNKDAAWARVQGLIASLPVWRTARQEQELRRANDQAQIASMKFERAQYESH